MTCKQDVPYQGQRTIFGAERTCGAAALAMAYRSFGQEISNADIWRRVATRDPGGELRVRTHRLAADAMRRGRVAVCVRAGDGWAHGLRGLLAAGQRVIVNHLHALDAPHGHFSAVASVARGAVTLHDPLLGPNRRLSHDAFQALWMPAQPTYEVSGGVLVAIGPARPSARSRACPVCGNDFPLPLELGLSWTGPWHASWTAAYCPHCDACVRPNRRVRLSA